MQPIKLGIFINDALALCTAVCSSKQHRPHDANPSQHILGSHVAFVLGNPSVPATCACVLQTPGTACTVCRLHGREAPCPLAAIRKARLHEPIPPLPGFPSPLSELQDWVVRSNAASRRTCRCRGSQRATWLGCDMAGRDRRGSS